MLKQNELVKETLNKYRENLKNQIFLKTDKNNFMTFRSKQRKNKHNRIEIFNLLSISLLI